MVVHRSISIHLGSLSDWRSLFGLRKPQTDRFCVPVKNCQKLAQEDISEHPGVPVGMLGESNLAEPRNTLQSVSTVVKTDFSEFGLGDDVVLRINFVAFSVDHKTIFYVKRVHGVFSYVIEGSSDRFWQNLLTLSFFSKVVTEGAGPIIREVPVSKIPVQS